MTVASDNDLKRFITRQRALLRREKDADIERTSLLLSNCGHKLLEQKGLALGGLGVVSVQIGLGGKSLIELDRPGAYHTTSVFPPHTFRPGDLARIDEHVPTSTSGKRSNSKMGTVFKEDHGGLDGVVYKVSDTRIVLAIDPSTSNEDLEIPGRCRLVKLANTVTYDRMDKAMEQLERLVCPNQVDSSATDSQPPRSSTGLNALHRVLLGISTPNTSLARKNTLNIFFDRSLNQSQLSAVKFALDSPEVACIHGPPGTGKTRVLVEVIRQLVYAPFLDSLGKGTDMKTYQMLSPKILVCGASNLAVDNLLERLSTTTPTPGPVSILASGDPSTETKTKISPPPHQHPFPPLTLTRVGHPARVLSSLHSKTLDSQAQESDEAALVGDIKIELEDLMCALSGTASRSGAIVSPKVERGTKPRPGTSSRGESGRSGTRKSQRLRGEERKKAWQTVRDLRKEYRKREGGIIKSVLAKAQVVLATCHGAGSRQLYNSEFDVVIIDEATQALEAVCWVPVLKARKLILAGDPLQLGPTIISEGDRKHAKKNKEKVRTKGVVKPAESGKMGTLEGVKPVERPNHPDDHDDILAEESEGESNSESSGSSAAEAKADTSKHVDQQGGNNPSQTSSLLLPPRSLTTTMFERLEVMHGGRLKCMLDVQYRMNEKISAFPSKTLYQSRLSSHPSNASCLLRDLPEVSNDAEYDDVVGDGTEVIFWDTAGAEFWERSGNEIEGGTIKNLLEDGSLCNENEAEVVKKWVDRLVEAGVKPSEIAIITPYQAQSQLISTMLLHPELEIGTVDGMQGREREAVIVSLVRSNSKGEVGFLKEKRRLNVAMTRAKRQLCVVGDSSTIRRGGGKYLRKWISWLETHADVRFAGDEL